MPITYDGPIPKTPSPGTTNEPASTVAEWQIYQTYQTLLQNIRYENERAADREAKAARQIVQDGLTERLLAADTALSTAHTKLAEGYQALAAAYMARPVAVAPAPLPLPVPIDPAAQPTGLLAEAFGVVRRLVASYKAGATSP